MKVWLKRAVLGSWGAIAAGGAAIAQSAPPQSPELPPLPRVLPPATDAPIVAPPVSAPATPLLPTDGGDIYVRDIQLLDSTVLSAEDVAELTAAYRDRWLSFEDLIAIRTAVTDLYVRRGYTTSGAFLPPQDVTNGVVRVQVVEGRLEGVTIEGLSRISPGYVRDRLLAASEPPLNLTDIEAALQQLQQDPAIASVRAELVAGSAPGLSELRLDLREAFPLDLTLTTANRNSPSVGSLRPSAQLWFHSPLGIGDRLTAEVGVTSGVLETFAEYRVPLNPRDTQLSLSYNRGRSRVVEDPFDALDIRSTEETLTLGLSHPLIDEPNRELRLGVSLQRQRSRTFLFDDEPFSFSVGPEEGRSNLTVLQLTQDWSSRSLSQVFAARSQFSLGLDAFDATRNDDAPDGVFFAWLGQAQWVRSLAPDTLLVARAAAQIASDELLPVSQFAIGGPNTVRGYLQNQRVGDSGWLASLELRYPLLRNSPDWGTLSVVPFLDVGTVWNLGDDRQLPDPSTLVGAGLGLRWQLSPSFSARLDWGVPLVGVDERGDSLQGDGLYFSVEYSPF